MRWECNSCGACCKSHDVDENGRLIDGGPCRNLVKVSDATYTCAIYEDRPWFCRVDTSRPAEELFSECDLIRKVVE